MNHRHLILLEALMMISIFFNNTMLQPSSRWIVQKAYQRAYSLSQVKARNAIVFMFRQKASKDFRSMTSDLWLHSKVTVLVLLMKALEKPHWILKSVRCCQLSSSTEKISKKQSSIDTTETLAPDQKLASTVIKDHLIWLVSTKDHIKVSKKEVNLDTKDDISIFQTNISMN